MQSLPSAAAGVPAAAARPAAVGAVPPAGSGWVEGPVAAQAGPPPVMVAAALTPAWTFPAGGRAPAAAVALGAPGAAATRNARMDGSDWVGCDALVGNIARPQLAGRQVAHDWGTAMLRKKTIPERTCLLCSSCASMSSWRCSFCQAATSAACCSWNFCHTLPSIAAASSRAAPPSWPAGFKAEGDSSAGCCRFFFCFCFCC